MNSHENLRYNFFFNKTRREFHVVPEGKTGGPNSFPFGDFKLEQDDERTYNQYEADLLAELEAAINTLQDIDPTEFTVKIIGYGGVEKTIPPGKEVVKDPIEPEIPVPVSGEIRAKAKGITGGEAG
ncbi:hypothetical protein HYP93_gp23 [Stenotrophomonas phage Pokken]|uniref:Uncharacterized protein n=1 Tax=Stenotrophomonas phage Pokken TaxID=2596674 RepID=A0A5B9N9G1_9CAUD|nr:hypothetical protein HYP93_gp23 [Stenotrophomonas phage Pokken]QEG09246.1 hypothetical protein CPT_Pokken_023 [Stenotrophomonas phage Pokken]